MIQVIAVVAAVLLLAVVWVSALGTVYVPGLDPPGPPRGALRVVASFLVTIGRGLSRRRGDRVLGLIAPVSLFLVFLVWLAGLTIGFALAAWGLGGIGLDPASYAQLAAFGTGGAIVGLALLNW